MLTGYGDASACLMLRIPLIRRDRFNDHQVLCPARSRANGPKAHGFRRGASFLIDAEVAFDLPRRHMFDVIKPLFPLGRHEVFEEVVS